MLRQQEVAAVVPRAQQLERAALVQFVEDLLDVAEAAGGGGGVGGVVRPAEERRRRVGEEVGEREEQRDVLRVLRGFLLERRLVLLPLGEHGGEVEVLRGFAGVPDVGVDLERLRQRLDAHQ